LIQFLEGSGDKPQSSSFGSVAKTLGFSDQCIRLISPAADSVSAVQFNLIPIVTIEKVVFDTALESQFLAHDY
jgi:hypothetical protein